MPHPMIAGSLSEKDMSARDPSEYPKRIFLAVVGLTPQVVTESLYFLAVRRSPPFVPTEIHVVSTEEGRNRVRDSLFGSETGALADLVREYQLPQLLPAIAARHIHVFVDDTGNPLQDITTPGENVLAANLLVRIVGRLTRDDAAALHVSIAGGRKTMGFLAGYALSLYGRVQDRLSHVLVPEPFESHPRFFFPPRRPRTLFARDSRPIRTDAAVVTLAEIPFVRLREGLPRRLLGGEGTYADAVRGVQQQIVAPSLVLDPRRRTAWAEGQALNLPPLLFVWLLWMARRRLKDPQGGALHWSEVEASEFLAVCRDVYAPDDPYLERIVEAVKGGMAKEYFEEKKARLNKLVRDQLGDRAWPYCLQGSGRRPRTRFGLPLPANTIRIVEALDNAPRNGEDT